MSAEEQLDSAAAFNLTISYEGNRVIVSDKKIMVAMDFEGCPRQATYDAISILATAKIKRHRSFCEQSNSDS